MASDVDVDGDVRALHERYARTRDPGLRDALVRKHARLAQALAARFGPRGSQTPDDVLQVAYIGLLKAINGFDPARGFQFSTYATRTILGELKRNLRDNSWIIRPPRSVHDLYLTVEASVDELTQALGRVPTIAEVAEHVGADEERVIEARDAGALRLTRSLDKPPRGARRPLSEAVGGDDDALHGVEDRAALRRVMARLSDDERTILRLRAIEELSQRQIAQQVGSSQMHVSRVLSRLRTRVRGVLAESA